MILSRPTLRGSIQRIRSLTWRGHLHTDIRRQMIESHLGQVGPSAVVVFGDSRVEAALLPSTISGRPVVNAGIGSATAGMLNDIAPQFVAGTKLGCVVISVGINNAKHIPSAAEDFHQCLRGLAGVFAARSDLVILTTIAPVLASAPLGAGYYSREKIAACNATIAGLAAEQHYGLIDIVPAMSNDHGDLRQEYSNDGVHFTASGYEVWKRELVNGISEGQRSSAPGDKMN